MISICAAFAFWVLVFTALILGIVDLVLLMILLWRSL